MLASPQIGFLHGGIALDRVGLYEVLQDWLGQITTRWQFFMGLLLVLVVLFMPGGMAGLFRLIRDRAVTLGGSRTRRLRLEEQARRAS